MANIGQMRFNENDKTLEILTKNNPETWEVVKGQLDEEQLNSLKIQNTIIDSDGITVGEKIVLNKDGTIIVGEDDGKIILNEDGIGTIKAQSLSVDNVEIGTASKITIDEDGIKFKNGGIVIAPDPDDNRADGGSLLLNYNKNNADGAFSLAANKDTSATRAAATALGIGTSADKLAQLAAGRYNIKDSDGLFVLGSGHTDNSRRNSVKMGGDYGAGYIVIGDKYLNIQALIGNYKTVGEKRIEFNLNGVVEPLSFLELEEDDPETWRADINTSKEEYDGRTPSYNVEVYSVTDNSNKFEGKIYYQKYSNKPDNTIYDYYAILKINLEDNYEQIISSFDSKTVPLIIKRLNKDLYLGRPQNKPKIILQTGEEDNAGFQAGDGTSSLVSLSSSASENKA